MTQNSKFLILLIYCDRPRFLQLALNSIKIHDYDNWELAVLDDGSHIPAEPIVREVLAEHLHKIKFYSTNDTVEDKVRRGGAEGSVVGRIAQEAIENSDADYAFILCEDDMLYPNYMNNLNKYFQEHPDEKYVYSHIHIYDPVLSSVDDNPPFVDHHLNKTEPLNPHFKIDASQVAWNRGEYVKHNIQFPYPMTVNWDSVIYNQMYNVFGNCNFSGFIGQYKGMHQGHQGYDDQMSHRMGKFISGQISAEEVYKVRIE